MQLKAKDAIILMIVISLRMKARLPSSPAEWQSAVDAAMGNLLLAAACDYELALTRQQVNEGRTFQILGKGKQRGFASVHRPRKACHRNYRNEGARLHKLLLIGLEDPYSDAD